MIKPEDCQRIKDEYQASGGDSSRLFQVVLEAAGEDGLEEALACLEQCVSEKRSAWMERSESSIPGSGDPVMDAFRLFYQRYLGLSIPQDGEIVEATPRRIVSRWWNPCPTLEACQKFGLDTREVCRRVYQQPVEVMLRRIDPRLRFRRNYAVLRPYQACCEEIIELEEKNLPRMTADKRG